MVNFSHAYLYRSGNFNCFLSHIARWFPIANNLQEFFAHAVLFLILDNGVSVILSIYGAKIFYFVFLARYFFSPSSSLCDGQVLFARDEPPGHTVPIRYSLVF